MFGSLDSMHTVWNNCPAAWQGSFKGTEKNLQLFWKPSQIITQGSGTYHMDLQTL